MRCWIAVGGCIVACGRLEFATVERFDATDGTSDDADLAVTDAAPDSPGADAAEFVVSQCPATYTTTLASSTHRYRIVAGSLTWPQAAAACVSDQVSPSAPTHLATLSNDTERDELSALVTLVWIGLSDRRTEGTFIPVTLEDVVGYPPATSPPWGPGEPNNNLGSEHCVQIAGNRLLNDFGCGIGTSYICECDPHADAPSQY